MGLLNIEVIMSIEIDMSVARGPDMREIAVLDRITFLFKLLDGGGHVNGVPQNHRVGDQVQAAGLMGEGFFLLAS